MSANLSPTDEEALAELRAIFGTVSGMPYIDPDGRAAARLAQDARGLLIEATHQDKITLTELARRLGVSKAAISRQMNSDGDIKVGTLAIIARALGREVEITLRKSTPPASGQ